MIVRPNLGGGGRHAAAAPVAHLCYNARSAKTAATAALTCAPNCSAPAAPTTRQVASETLQRRGSTSRQAAQQAGSTAQQHHSSAAAPTCTCTSTPQQLLLPMAPTRYLPEDPEFGLHLTRVVSRLPGGGPDGFQGAVRCIECDEGRRGASGRRRLGLVGRREMMELEAAVRAYLTDLQKAAALKQKRSKAAAKGVATKTRKKAAADAEARRQASAKQAETRSAAVAQTTQRLQMRADALQLQPHQPVGQLAAEMDVAIYAQRGKGRITDAYNQHYMSLWGALKNPEHTLAEELLRGETSPSAVARITVWTPPRLLAESAARRAKEPDGTAETLAGVSTTAAAEFGKQQQRQRAKDLASRLGVTELASTASFPAALAAFRDTLAAVEGAAAARTHVESEAAGMAASIKAAVVRAEDARLLGDMPALRRAHRRLADLNRDMWLEHGRRLDNQAALLQGLRGVNAMIQAAAALRVGPAAARVVAACRAAVKANNLAALERLVCLGCA